MIKILAYILKRGAEVIVTAIPAPLTNPENMQQCFEKVFAHEVDNTEAIYKLVKMSNAEEVWAT